MRLELHQYCKCWEGHLKCKSLFSESFFSLVRKHSSEKYLNMKWSDCVAHCPNISLLLIGWLQPAYRAYQDKTSSIAVNYHFLFVQPNSLLLHFLNAFWLMVVGFRFLCKNSAYFKIKIEVRHTTLDSTITLLNPQVKVKEIKVKN